TDPAVARAAADRVVERAASSVSPNLGGGRIADDLETLAVDCEAAEVAVAEVGGVHEPVVRRDGQPAELGRQARARIDRDERAYLALAVLVDRAEDAPVANGRADHESVR